QAAVSRQREFLADASAVQFTRNPSGITNALKKIGGYALGSNIQSSKASELSHFFFAQGFRSMFGGMWATHPPLDERIRAVDASFDGKYFAPPEVVDVAKDSWRKVTPPRPPVSAGLSDPVAIAAAIGTIEAAHTDRARVLFDAIPVALREAAHSPDGAGAIVCGLLLDANAALRTAQRDLIKRHAGEAISAALAPLEKELLALSPEARLPLLLLTPPALRKLPPEALNQFLGTLDELVHADKKVSVFEFSLQKVLTHHLQLAAHPSGRREIYSPAQVSTEIAVLLSFAARLHSTDEVYVKQAFNAGAAQFAGLHPVVTLLPVTDSQLDRLDTALDKLALAYGPVKKRTIIAVAATLAYDGQAQPEDGELLRALSSTLDCPMPPAI
ncbi:MAG: M48 family metalloprotease, partial [Rariglobus sp.]